MPNKLAKKDFRKYSRFSLTQSVKETLYFYFLIKGLGHFKNSL